MSVSRHLLRTLCLCLFLALLAALTLSALVSAAPTFTAITVDSFSDTVDANPGDGICADAGGSCSLRAAIMEANALANTDTILLRSGIYALSLTGAGNDTPSFGDLDVTSEIILVGTGENSTTLTAGQIDRVLHVHNGASLQIAGVTLRDGQAGGAGSAGDGGGVLVDGGATLTMVDTTVSNNIANHWGGGIHVDEGATATISRTLVTQNTANTLGGGIDNYKGTVNLFTSEIRANIVSNGPGGGVYNGADATTTIFETTIDGNQASTDGGGIYNYAGSTFSTGSLEITSSTVSNNTATLNGGGILNFGDITLIENVTISGNTANDKGGGIYNQDNIALINHTTIADNNASATGGGLYNEVDSLVEIRNSIVSANVQANCALEDADDLTSSGNNIESANTCNFALGTDRPGTDPELGTLQDNGGATHSHMPAESSQAIDNGNTTKTVSIDQRGIARPQASGVDIGAVEREMANLTISKIDDPEPVDAGARLTYTVTFENLGESTALNVVMTDTLPSTVTFVETIAPSNVACSQIGTAVRCSKAQLAVNERIDIIIVVTAPDEGGAITNVASIGSDTTDPVSSNNSAEAITTVTAVANLSITKDDTFDPILADEALQYQIKVANSGPSVATNVVVTDTLAAGVDYDNAAGDGWNCTFASSTVTCTVDQLAVGDAPTILLDVFAPQAGGVLYNEAFVSSDTKDIDVSNNRDEEYTQITAKADLRIVKTDAPDPVFARQLLTYTLTVNNIGPSAAQNVVITDSLPADTVFQSAVGSGWTCQYNSDPHNVICELASLPTSTVAQEITLAVLAPQEGGMITNQATVGSSVIDDVMGNNVASAETTVSPVADLEVSQTHSPDPVDAAAALVYTISSENAGPSTSAGVTIRNTLPSDVTIVSAVGSGWDCTIDSNNNVVNCTRLTVAVGTMPDIVLTVNAPNEGGITTNSAEISGLEDDFDPDDNQAIESANVTPISDLQIEISDSPDPINVSRLLLYTLVITNHGPSTAQNIIVTQQLPASVTFVSASGDDWNCTFAVNFHRIACEFTSLAAGEGTQINVIVMTPEQATVLTTTANVSSDIADRNSANNNDSEDTYVNPADLALEIMQQPIRPPGITGRRIEYMLRAINLGSGDALGTKVTMLVPNGVIIECETTCTQVSGVITWVLPPLMERGDTYVMRFTSEATVVDHLVATAFIESPIVLDLNHANNHVEIVLNTFIQYLPIQVVEYDLP